MFNPYPPRNPPKGRVRVLSTLNAINDTTVTALYRAGWRKSEGDSWLALWFDPRTDRAYTLSQAAAILKDRAAVIYRFGSK